MSYDVIVVGGALAGCSVAIQLAEQNYEVLLLEKDTFPRHKLCGEFLSPEAQASLRGLGVLDAVCDAGAREIHGAFLAGPTGTSTSHALPGTALGISRHSLDTLLFRRARAAGADGRMGAKVTSVQGTLKTGFSVDTTGGTFESRIVIGAYGRRGVLDRTLDRPFLQKSSPYVAFKAHYEGPSGPGAENQIELYAAPGGYCGIGPVEEDRYNVCWIGRTAALKQAGGTPEAMISDVLEENPLFKARIRPLSRVTPRFEAVSQVPLMPKSRFAGDVCMVGDAAGMIAPLCGDGMAMALTTADVVVPLVADVLDGEQSASAFRAAYETRWSRTFGRRMRIGRWIHAAAFRPTLTTGLLRICTILPPIARWLIRATRGSPGTDPR